MNRIPVFGLGTFRLEGQVVIDSVRNDLELGYHVINTAQIHDDEAEVGEAIAGSGVRREDLFLTTKIWVDNYVRGKLAASLEDSLTKLYADYVDLTLIHQPTPDNGVLIEGFMTTLAKAKARGLTREIDVSNLNIVLTQQAITVASRDAIAANRIELSPYLQSRRPVEFLQRRDIHVTPYMTLAYDKMLGDSMIGAIAQRHETTPAQIVLARTMQLDYLVIPSSTKREYLVSNLRAQTLHLTDEDMARIAALERNGREVSPDGLTSQWD